MAGRIIIVGGGFAGVFAALAAARTAAGQAQVKLPIVLVQVARSSQSCVPVAHSSRSTHCVLPSPV